MNAPDAAALQAIFHGEIPISKAMGVAVRDYDGETLVISADLEPNVNLHGTAFAGSLYAICALCGWGSTHLQLAQRSLSGDIVIADGRIRYARPVTDTIVVRCTFASNSAPWEQLRTTGKARFELICTVGQGVSAAAEFHGLYAVRVRG